MYKKIKRDDVPKRGRKSGSRFENTPEWRAMRADIERGLKPQDALQVILTPDDKKRYKIKNRRTIARFVKSYLEKHGHKYSVKSFNRDANDFIVVLCPLKSTV